MKYEVNVPDVEHTYTFTKEQVEEALTMWCALHHTHMVQGKSTLISIVDPDSRSMSSQSNWLHTLTVKVKVSQDKGEWVTYDEADLPFSNSCKHLSYY